MPDGISWAALSRAAEHHLRRLSARGRGRVRFGLLVPWANSAVEDELPRFLKADAGWHVARLVPATRSTALDDRFLDGLIDAVPAAIGQLARLDLSGIGLACTSAGFHDAARLRRRVRQTSASVEVISAFDAICRSLRRLAARSIMLVTPYTEVVTAREAQALCREGFEVVGSAALGRTDGFSEIDPGELVRARYALAGAADVTVVSCTALRTVEAIDRLEGDGVGTLSSNSCLAAALALGAR